MDVMQENCEWVFLFFLLDMHVHASAIEKLSEYYQFKALFQKSHI